MFHSSRLPISDDPVTCYKPYRSSVLKESLSSRAGGPEADGRADTDASGE